MFLNNVFHFAKGYVIINVSGIGIERFLYICAKRNIVLFNMGVRTDEGVTLCMSISDFKRIKPAVRKSGAQVRIKKRCGLPFFIKRFRKRYVLFFGFVVIAAAMFASSLFIWSVEINSPGGAVPADLPEAIRNSGVYIGAFKPSLPKGDDIKNIILDNTDDIMWVWTYIKGTKAIVEYRNGIPAPKSVKISVPCSIIARRDGLIMSVTEKNGSAAVKKGDTVLKGDVLISGVSRLSENPGLPVHAIGDVKAYTWHEKSREYPLVQTLSEPTGSKKSYYTLKLFSKCINLYTRENIDFESYEIKEEMHELSFGKENYSGIGIYKKTYIQTNESAVPADYNEVVRSAANELEAEIGRELLPGSVLSKRECTHTKTENGTVKVTVSMEFIENIGEETANEAALTDNAIIHR